MTTSGRMIGKLNQRLSSASPRRSASKDQADWHWRRVALIAAKRTGHKIGPDIATRMLGRDDEAPR